MARPSLVIATIVLLGALISACGSPSPWQSSPLPTATPVPGGMLFAVPPAAANTSPSATSPPSGQSPAQPSSH